MSTPTTSPAVPMSEQQHWVWLADRLASNTPAYNVPRLLCVRGELDPGALESALRQVADRHQVLRTLYTERGSEAWPVVQDAAGLRVRVVDLSGMPEPDRAAHARDHADREARHVFDLRAEFPVRVSLVRCAEDEWYLVAVFHHIAVDAQSLGLFWDELSAAYRAASAGLPWLAEPLSCQYSDYADWSQRVHTDGATDGDLAYWRAKLAAPVPLQLPLDHSRPAVRSGLGSRLAFPFPADTAAALRAFCSKHRVTPFAALMAAFAAAAGRWTGQADVMVGTPLALRPRAEFESLIGLFVNTTVLRTDLCEEPSFVDVVRQVQEDIFEAYDHQHAPFARLVAELQPDRDSSRNPLFDVMFTVQDESAAALRAPGLDCAEIGVESGTSKVDIAVTVTDGQYLSGMIEYDTALFTADTARRFAASYVRLLADALAGPDRCVGELEVLTAEDAAELARRNETEVRYPDAATVPELFAAAVRRDPTAVAVRCGAERMSYGELDAASDALAAALRHSGVAPGVGVALCLDRTPRMLVAMLAVLKAGGCYVPVDPEYPRQRIGHILADARPRLLLTTSDRLPAVEPHPGVESWCLDRLDTDAYGPATGVAPAADDLAYVIYTSGTTGRPKGVMVPHRGVLNLSASMCRDVGIGPHDTVAALASYAFDMSVPELITPLLAGATVALLPRETVMDPAGLASAVAEAGVTVMQATPTMWRMLLDIGWSGPGLRAVAGAEAVPSALAAELVGRVAALWNYYGPTETTVWSVRGRIGSVAADRPLPIGAPMDNTTVYILDNQFRAVPPGVVGEVFIGGHGVTRGYHGRAALTAERYIPDPFGSGGRLYRTSDLARWLPDGTLECLGRSDSQVKVRGHRIELAEVETVLAGHPEVARAAATVHGVDGNRRLAGYVVWRNQGSTEALRDHLRARLPEYMVPSAIVELDALPLNANGKVDRAALPVPKAAAAKDSVEPRTPLERQVADLVAGILELPSIGLHDDFFAAGGHSLHAIRLVTQLRAAFRVELPIRQVFTHSTVARLVAALAEAGAAGGGLTRRAGNTPAPLSYAQRQMWFLQQLHNGRGDLNVHTVLRLRGPLDVEALRAAVATVADRHEVLRGRFELSDGMAVQVPQPQRPPVRLMDLTTLAAEDQEARARAIAEDEIAAPFDLASPPLLRVLLLRLSPEEHLLVLTVHHAVMDGWSWGVLRKELASAYSAYSRGRQPDLPPLPVSYGDFAYWQQHRDAAEVRADLEFWRQRLADAPSGELPTDRPRPAMRSGRGAEIRFAFCAKTTAAIRRHSRDHAATAFQTLLAAFHYLLAVYTHAEESILGTPVACREDPALEGLVGCFINFLALRCDVSGDPTFAELTARTREELLAALGHQQAPFAQLVEELQPDRDASRNPFFQVMFTMDDSSVGKLELPGLTADVVRMGETAAKFDLTLSLADTGETIDGSLVYDTDLFQAATAGRLAEAYRRLVEQAVAEPGLPLSRLDLVGPEDSARVLAGPSAAQAVPVYRQFSTQAARTPDATALRFGGDRLSYAELDARANRLAHWLIARDVRPDTPVGVALRRGLDLVTALLGILKAGAGYVAVDLTYPVEHNAAALGNSRAGLVLTEDELATRLAGHGVPVVSLATVQPELHRYPPTEPEVEVGPDQLAAVFYSSGSTGAPKGIATTHRGPANYMRYVREATGVGAGDTALQIAAPCFDASAREIFGALAHGAELILLADEQARDPYAIARAITKHRVTVLLSLVPSMVSALAVGAKEPGYDGDSLRIAMVGGEVLGEQHLADSARIGPRLQVINHYGPTECTMTSAYHRVAERCGPPPIGQPIPGARAYVLDRHGRPAPQGALGELYLSSVGLARGYVGAPGLTAERFLPDPAGPPGGRLYRTGDLVRRTPDDRLTFHGRLDGQIKLRGIRVEPGAVETRIARFPGVRAVAVVARGESLCQELVAFVELEESGFDIAAMAAAMSAELPKHLVPARFAAVQEMPLTATGKVDRRRLAAMPLDDIASTTGPAVAARDSVELRMIEVWERLLEHRPIGVRHDFFAIGGHSLKAVQLVDSIKREFGVALPLSAIFTSPTVEGLCAVLDHRPAGLIVLLASEGGTGTPLFLIHPQGGDVCCYATLARQLAADRDVYGIEAVGLNSEEEPLGCIEEMVERYLAELRRVRPVGPYALAGWSFGGNVAYAMALRLEAEGESVEFIGAIDARVFGRDEVERWYQDKSEAERYRIGAELAVDCDITDLDEQDFLDVLLRDARAKDRVSLRADSATMRRMMRIFTANGYAAEKYRCQDRVRADIYLFRATGRHPTLPNPKVDPAGWRDRTSGQLHVIDLPGNHHDVVYPPRAVQTAEFLQTALGLACARRDGSKP